MKETPEAQIKRMCDEIVREIGHWESMVQKGCQDPFWTDGVNLNLTRNHVIYYKGEIVRICEEANIELPGEYYMPLPPEVDGNFMADSSSDRYRKLNADPSWSGKLVDKKPEYRSEQFCLPM